ncbi:MAG: anti-sigma factor antagonist [Bryobacteraceae bacterium]|nr:anti-sigma factor antagonist [Bryobacteraceae bacterium]
MPLAMNSSLEGKTARLELSGELDGNSAPSVRQEVEKILGASPDRLVMVVDRLTFMASAGLRILIFAKQRQPGLKIYMVQPQPTIVDTLKKTGFYDGVYVVDSEDIDKAAAG